MVTGQTRHVRPINLRDACGSTARESALEAAIAHLQANLARTGSAHVVWPADRDLASAARVFRCPLAHVVATAVSGSVPAKGRRSLTIHTRNSSVADFLAMAPLGGVHFVFHINGEEAAMRWEREDAAPTRRILAAARLRLAGWAVSFVLGPVRNYRGCREDYAEILSRLPVEWRTDLEILFSEQDATATDLFHAEERPVMATTGWNQLAHHDAPPARRLRRELGRMLHRQLAAAA